MTKETITLFKGEDYVIVDPGSRAHDHFVSMGYREKGAVEKSKPKRRVKDSSATVA